jgi:SAM-dependent methyltransferase
METWPDAAEFMGAAYLRYSFTKGTEQEAAFLVDALALKPGMRVLDVGCGPGRHAHALAGAGMVVHGVDISPRFIELARARAGPNETFEVADAAELRHDDAFDVALSLCQGGLLLPLDRMAAAAPLVAFTAFNAYFAVRHLEPGDDFDPATGTNTEQTEVRDEAGNTRPFTLTSEVFTPRELRLLCDAAGLVVERMHAVGPGDYAARPPDLDHPELLVIARRS